MVFLQPAEQTHPRLRVGPTPVRAHTPFSSNTARLDPNGRQKIEESYRDAGLPARGYPVSAVGHEIRGGEDSSME